MITINKRSGLMSKMDTVARAFVETLVFCMQSGIVFIRKVPSLLLDSEGHQIDRRLEAMKAKNMMKFIR